MDKAVEKPGYGELIEAVLKKDSVAVAGLLERGAEVEEMNEHGTTPLMLVLILNLDDRPQMDEVLKIVNLLVDYGADPYRQDNYHWSALTILEVSLNECFDWREPELFIQIHGILTHAPERHEQFLERRAAAAVVRQAEEDKKITEMQQRINSNARGFKVRPPRQIKQGM